MSIKNLSSVSPLVETLSASSGRNGGNQHRKEGLTSLASARSDKLTITWADLFHGLGAGTGPILHVRCTKLGRSVVENSAEIRIKNRIKER